MRLCRRAPTASTSKHCSGYLFPGNSTTRRCRGCLLGARFSCRAPQHTLYTNEQTNCLTTGSRVVVQSSLAYDCCWASWKGGEMTHNCLERLPGLLFVVEMQQEVEGPSLILCVVCWIRLRVLIYVFFHPRRHFSGETCGRTNCPEIILNSVVRSSCLGHFFLK